MDCVANVLLLFLVRFSPRNLLAMSAAASGSDTFSPSKSDIVDV